MTSDEVKVLKANELKKLEALEQIVAILEKLESDVDDEAAEWVKERLAE